MKKHVHYFNSSSSEGKHVLYSNFFGFSKESIITHSQKLIIMCPLKYKNLTIQNMEITNPKDKKLFFYIYKINRNTYQHELLNKSLQNFNILGKSLIPIYNIQLHPGEVVYCKSNHKCFIKTNGFFRGKENVSYR